MSQEKREQEVKKFKEQGGTFSMLSPWLIEFEKEQMDIGTLLEVVVDDRNFKRHLFEKVKKEYIEAFIKATLPAIDYKLSPFGKASARFFAELFWR